MRWNCAGSGRVASCAAQASALSIKVIMYAATGAENSSLPGEVR
jgi:hypothetical protein